MATSSDAVLPAAFVLIGTAMSRPRILSDDEVVSRARSIFLEQGYRAGTRQLAAAIGLTWPALVARFGGKRELFARAIVEPICKPADFGVPGDDVDLPELLERLSGILQERWLMRLQYRLAASSSAPDYDSDALTGVLASAVAHCTKSGPATRSLTAEQLARLVIALLVGDIVQRLIRCDGTVRADSDLVDGLVTLLAQASSNKGADKRGSDVQDAPADGGPSARPATSSAVPPLPAQPGQAQGTADDLHSEVEGVER